MKNYWSLLKGSDWELDPSYNTSGNLVNFTINANWYNTSSAEFICYNLYFMQNCNIDFSNGTPQNFSFYDAFGNCESLTTLNVSNWNMTNVNNLGSAFYRCGQLQNFDVSNWDISNVRDLSFIFFYAPLNLDVSNWNVCNVRNLTGAFSSSYISNLDVSNWNVGNVDNFAYTFEYCGFNNLNVSNWNIHNAKNLCGLFSGSSNLIDINVSNWNTYNVFDARYIFSYCSNLTNLNVSKWNTANFTHISGMFDHCSNLTNLDISNWIVNNIKSLNGTFSVCNNLTMLNLAKWNTDNVIDMNYAFRSCNNLINLYLNNCHFNNVGINNWFYTFESIPINCNIFVYDIITKKQFLSSRNDLTNIRVCQSLDLEPISALKIMNNRIKTVNLLYDGLAVADHPNNFNVAINPTQGEVFTAEASIDTTNQSISLSFEGTGEGEDTATLTLADDENNSISKEISINSIAYSDGEYVIESIPNITYGFTLDSTDNKYKSDNTGHGYSYAICKVKFTTYTGKISITCTQQTSSSAYNYGTISQIDTTLPRSYSSDGNPSVTLKNLGNVTRAYTFNNIDDEEHFIEIKYRIYNNSTAVNNNLAFSISFTI